MPSKIKTLKYLISNDKNLLKWFFKKPFIYTYRFIVGSIKNRPPLFGVKSLSEFKELLKDPNNLLVLGFSYCHKPKKCPEGFFSPICHFNSSNQICQNCDIGKYQSRNPIIITTVNELAKKLLEITSQHKKGQILFIISACPFSVNLFGNFANMLSIKGLAIILEGKVCSSFDCFALAEKGKKINSTILPASQKKILDELLPYKYK